MVKKLITINVLHVNCSNNCDWHAAITLKWCFLKSNRSFKMWMTGCIASSNYGNDAVLPRCFWVTSNRPDRQPVCWSWTDSNQLPADPTAVWQCPSINQTTNYCLTNFLKVTTKTVLSNHNANKIPLETADFALVPPLGNFDETYASSLILACSVRYIKNTLSSAKPDVHNVLHCHQMRIEPQS